MYYSGDKIKALCDPPDSSIKVVQSPAILFFVTWEYNLRGLQSSQSLYKGSEKGGFLLA